VPAAGGSSSSSNPGGGSSSNPGSGSSSSNSLGPAANESKTGRGLFLRKMLPAVMRRARNQVGVAWRHWLCMLACRAVHLAPMHCA
jgi:hypothetical protein